MPSSVLSVRVPDDLSEQLDTLSRATKRSRSWLATEALGEYVRRNAWKARELSDALAQADKGSFISHEAMVDWVDCLGTAQEKAPPKPDVQIAHKQP